MSDLCSSITLRFYDAAGTLKTVFLPEAQGIQFTDELAGDGGAGYSTTLLAQALKTQPDLLENGICKAAMVLAPGEDPTEVFAWELIPTSGTLVGRVADKKVQCTAPGLRNLLSYAPVESERGPLDSNSEDARLFGWMSAANSYWYSSGDWTTPSSYGALTSKNFPTKAAQMITADTSPAVGDVHLFRATFNLPASGQVRVYWYADDESALFLDSEAFGTSQAGDTSVQAHDARLSAGTHTIAAQVTNVFPSRLVFTCVVATVNEFGAPDKILLITDTTHWKVHKVTGTKPGWSIGAILRKLFDEATALSSYGITLLTPDFTGAVDSAGTPWPDLEEIGFLVGQTSLLDVVRKLEEMGAEVRITPQGTFQAFVVGGQGALTSVFLRPGSNLLHLDYAGSPVAGTKAYIRVYIGWTNVTDTTGVSLYGNRYLGITSGTSLSVAQGQRLGRQVLAEAASPKYIYTATLRAVPGAVPFRDFGVGSEIFVPDRAGDFAEMRVLSLGAFTPPARRSPVLFAAELKAV